MRGSPQSKKGVQRAEKIVVLRKAKRMRFTCTLTREKERLEGE